MGEFYFLSPLYCQNCIDTPILRRFCLALLGLLDRGLALALRHQMLAGNRHGDRKLEDLPAFE